MPCPQCKSKVPCKCLVRDIYKPIPISALPKLWLVWKCHDQEGRDLASIHLSPEGAREAKERLEALRKSCEEKLARYFESDDSDESLYPASEEIDSCCDSITIEERESAP